MVRMRAPLLEIKEKILAFRGSVDSSLAALQSRLKQRAQANEAREVLELLLDTFHVVSKVYYCQIIRLAIRSLISDRFLWFLLIR